MLITLLYAISLQISEEYVYENLRINYITEKSKILSIFKFKLQIEVAKSSRNFRFDLNVSDLMSQLSFLMKSYS